MSAKAISTSDNVGRSKSSLCRGHATSIDHTIHASGAHCVRCVSTLLNLCLVHDGAAFPTAAHTAGRIAFIGTDDDVVAMNFEQRPHEWKALKAASHAITDDVTDVESCRLEIKFKRAGLTHILHCSSPLAGYGFCRRQWEAMPRQ